MEQNSDMSFISEQIYKKVAGFIAKLSLLGPTETILAVSESEDKIKLSSYSNISDMVTHVHAALMLVIDKTNKAVYADQVDAAVQFIIENLADRESIIRPYIRMLEKDLEDSEQVINSMCVEAHDSGDYERMVLCRDLLKGVVKHLNAPKK